MRPVKLIAHNTWDYYWFFRNKKKFNKFLSIWLRLVYIRWFTFI